MWTKWLYLYLLPMSHIFTGRYDVIMNFPECVSSQYNLPMVCLMHMLDLPLHTQVIFGPKPVFINITNEFSSRLLHFHRRTIKLQGSGTFVKLFFHRKNQGLKEVRHLYISFLPSCACALKHHYNKLLHLILFHSSRYCQTFISWLWSTL